MLGADSMQLVGILVGIAVFAAIGILSGLKIKTKADYYIAGQSFGVVSVASSTAGMFIGGGCVIGTAQLAFTDGFSGVAFSIGCCIAILSMGLGFSRRIRSGGRQTIQEMINDEFGRTACALATLLGVLAFYVNNISQFLSGISLIGSVFPLSTFHASLITGAIILVCVFMGGFWGLSYINTLKSIILIATSVIAAGTIYAMTQGLDELAAVLPERFFNAFPRGAGTDLGNIFSAALGIMSTQSTIQAVYAAKSDNACRAGFTIGALVLPVVGICCTIIGMYMRAVAPEISSLQAFPMFIIMHTHGFVSGIILATTLVAVASAGVSVMLGIASILVNNIYIKVKPNAGTRSQLLFSRLVIVALLILTTVIINSGASDAIMQYNFLSMGLRFSVLFLPMCASLFLPGRIPAAYAMASTVLSPLALLAGNYLFELPFDSSFLGLAVSAVIMGAGLIAGNRRRAALR